MKQLIQKTARELGFAAVGITSAEPVGDFLHLENSIGHKRIGGMNWLARNPKARADPKTIMPDARSVICLALPYGEMGIEDAAGNGGDDPSSLRCSPQTPARTCASSPHYIRLLKAANSHAARRVIPSITSHYNRARFARGRDYHAVVREKLKKLWAAISGDMPNAKAALCCDTSPILEKALACRAGIGWIGKHTILVNKDLGSWFVLGEIITDLELEIDRPSENSCGDCMACIDACPTKAIVSPRALDASRCISYLTIENKGKIPDDMKRFIPDGDYGCDACQEACPYNISHQAT